MSADIQGDIASDWWQCAYTADSIHIYHLQWVPKPSVPWIKSDKDDITKLNDYLQ